MLGQDLHDGPLVDPPDPLPAAVGEVRLVLQGLDGLELEGEGRKMRSRTFVFSFNYFFYFRFRTVGYKLETPGRIELEKLKV